MNVFRASIDPNAEPELLYSIGTGPPVTRQVALQFTPDGEQIIISGLVAPEGVDNAIFIVDLPDEAE